MTIMSFTIGMLQVGIFFLMWNIILICFSSRSKTIETSYIYFFYHFCLMFNSNVPMKLLMAPRVLLLNCHFLIFSIKTFMVQLTLCLSLLSRISHFYWNINFLCKNSQILENPWIYIWIWNKNLLLINEVIANEPYTFYRIHARWLSITQIFFLILQL